MNYLNSGLVDIAFATTNERDDHFESYMCFKTHTAFVAAPDYDIDFDRTYTLKEISKLPQKPLSIHQNCWISSQYFSSCVQQFS